MNIETEPKRLLLVEDDFGTREILARFLRNAGYEVFGFPDSPEALRWIEREGLPHLVLVDLNLPTMHGFELSKRLKQMGDVPIIIMTSEDSEEMMITGIQEYAEDYIVKPVSGRVLIARVQRVLSRIQTIEYVGGRQTRVDDFLVINFAQRQLEVDGQHLDLTPIEARLLWILVNNREHVVRPELLLDRVWPGEGMGEDVLRVNLSRLRKKLGGTAGREYIITERGFGYKFVFP
jgi:DNA-binding response OmpR family regulator